MTVRGIPRDRLGVQIHCLRSEVAEDFEGTLDRLCALGIDVVELCLFPGFAGNPWGDFGCVGRWPARDVGDLLEEMGMHCVATHCMHRDLADERLEQTIAWARDVRSPAIVLAGFPPSTNLEVWRANFERLNATGQRMAGEGFTFAYHTQNDVWQSLGGALLANEMFRIVNPECCRIELDPSGSLVHGSDWTKCVLQHPNRYLSFHLRDGRRPLAPVPYLPALPLGDGDMDWRQTLDVAAAAGMPYYLLEMEVEDPHRVFPALQSSLVHLESLGAI